MEADDPGDAAGADVPGAIAAALDRLAGDLPRLGIALSGGGDSVALLHAAAAWGNARGVRIEAATVDHALRDGSAAEAAQAGRIAAALAVPHAVLRWDRRQPIAGNVMDAARRARMQLLAAWAAERGLPALALGHTQDDQAETLLMRLARGAGVDGLSAMAPARPAQGVLWLRPLLALRRADLRGWLAASGIPWIDDPTNEDATYDRIRVRRAIAALDLPVPALARSAAHLREARQALAQAALGAAAGARADRGALFLPRAAWAAAPSETRRRLTLAALRWVTGEDYAPRGTAVDALLSDIAGGAPATLAGVLVQPLRNEIAFLREPAAAARAPVARAQDGSALWDRRWRLTGLPGEGAVSAVGEAGLQAWRAARPGSDWRAAGLPRAALLSAPAVRGAGALRVPLLDARCGPSAEPLRGLAAFLAILATD